MKPLFFLLIAFCQLPIELHATSQKRADAKVIPHKKILTAENLLSKLQGVIGNADSYQTSYKQTVLSKVSLALGEKEGTVTTGTISYLKPDKFRWETKEDKSVQIINGKKLTLVEPNAQRGKTRVTLYDDYSQKMQLPFLEFLKGSQTLNKDFKTKLLDPKDGAYRIELTPLKGPKETYIAEIDKKSYFLASLELKSTDSSTLLQFVETELDSHLDAKLFEYQVKSSDVVRRH